jgi:branched-chain amino acid aminotransferase
MSTLTTTSGPSFALTPNPNPATRHNGLATPVTPAFGTVFTDHMVAIDWTAADGWTGHRVVPYGPLALSPATAALHYAQEVFEGLKAYRWADGSIHTFRPFANAERFTRSARRMALPELDPTVCVAGLEALVRVDQDWVPQGEGASLYLRPFMFASEPFVGVRMAHQVDFLIIASPVGAYFKGGVAPVQIWVDRIYHRAGPGGTGAAKCGGNYAASLLSQEQAYSHGCEQVLFTDAVNSGYVEELGGMNMMVVLADGTVVTPPTSGTILEGITRDSVLQLVRDRGLGVEERPIELAWLLDSIRSGAVAEVLACGTAAAVTPVGRLVSDDGGGVPFDVTVGDGQAGRLTMELYRELTDIQYGRAEDRHGWTHRLV